MAYYNVCPYCGSHLDPGEACDCREDELEEEPTTEEDIKECRAPLLTT